MMSLWFVVLVSLLSLSATKERHFVAQSVGVDPSLATLNGGGGISGDDLKILVTTDGNFQMTREGQAQAHISDNGKPVASLVLHHGDQMYCYNAGQAAVEGDLLCTQEFHQLSTPTDTAVAGQGTEEDPYHVTLTVGTSDDPESSIKVEYTTYYVKNNPFVKIVSKVTAPPNNDKPISLAFYVRTFEGENWKYSTVGGEVEGVGVKSVDGKYQALVSFIERGGGVPASHYHSGYYELTCLPAFDEYVANNDASCSTGVADFVDGGVIPDWPQDEGGVISLNALALQWPIATQGETTVEVFWSATTTKPAAVDVGTSDIEILGLNNVKIQAGSPAPSLLDGTEFDEVDIEQDTVIRDFTIVNRGTRTLLLIGDLTIAPNADLGSSDFSISTTPGSSELAARGGSTTFSLTFNPTAATIRGALVQLFSNTPFKTPYNFVVRGAGVTIPKIAVTADSLAVDFIQLVNREQSPALNTIEIRVPSLAPLDLSITGDRLFSSAVWAAGVQRFALSDDAVEFRQVLNGQTFITADPQATGNFQLFGIATSTWRVAACFINTVTATSFVAEWDINSGDMTPGSPIEASGCFDVAYAPNHDLYISTNSGTILKLANGASETIQFASGGDFSGSSNSRVQVTPSGSHVLVGTSGGKLVAVSTTTGNPIMVYSHPSSNPLAGLFLWKDDVAFAVSNSELLLVETSDNWNTASLTWNSVSAIPATCVNPTSPVVWRGTIYIACAAYLGGTAPQPAVIAADVASDARYHIMKVIDLDAIPISEVLDPVDFGDVDFKGAFQAQTIEVHSVGSSTLDIDVRITGPHSSQFALENLLQNPQTLSPLSGSVQFLLAFRPTSEGDKYAFVDIITNIPNVPRYKFAVTGNGQALPQFEISSIQNPIGNVILGESQTSTITIKSTGSGTVNMSTPTIAGDFTSDYVIDTTDFLTLLPPDTTSSFTIQFTPSVEGERYVDLSISSLTKPDFPQQRLLGRGITQPNIKVVSSAGNAIPNDDVTPSDEENTIFPDTDVLDDTQSQITYTIQNIGNAQATIKRIEILELTSTPEAPLTSGQFSATQPDVIAAATGDDSPGTVTFDVSFNPVTDELYSATVKVVYSWNSATTQGEATHEFRIRGQGIRFPQIRLEYIDNGTPTEVTNHVTATTTQGTSFGEVDINPCCDPNDENDACCDVFPNADVTHTFVLTNFGSADLEITAPVSSTHADFTLTIQVPGGVTHVNKQGGAATLNITFNPSQLGDITSLVTVTYNGGTFTFQLKGVGVAVPRLDVEGEGNFGEVDVYGTTSKTMSIAILNPGSGNLEFSSATPVSVAVHGVDGNPTTEPEVYQPFTIVAHPTVPLLEPGEFTSFTVKFDPQDIGQVAATITISTNVGDFALSGTSGGVVGTGIPVPVIRVFGKSVEISKDTNVPSVGDGTLFQPTDVLGEQFNSRTFEIKNLGSGELHLSELEILDDNGDFKFQRFDDDDFGSVASVIPGRAGPDDLAQSERFRVQFNPTVEPTNDLRTATVIIRNSLDDTVMFTFNIQGQALRLPIVKFYDGVNADLTQLTEILSQSGTPLSLGDVDWNPLFNQHIEGLTTKQYTLHNMGSGDLILTPSSFVSSNPDFTAATANGANPLIIPKNGGTGVIAISFNPSVFGVVNSDLDIVSTDAASPFKVKLTGTGIQVGKIQVQGSSFFGEAIISSSLVQGIQGETKERVYEIQNVGSGPVVILNIDLLNANGQYTKDLKGKPLPTLAVEEYWTFSVRFAPVDVPAGDVNCTLQISFDSTTSPYHQVLSGQGRVLPSVNVVYGNEPVPDSQAVAPSALAGTDFGEYDLQRDEILELEVTRTFTIQNVGSGTLILENITVTALLPTTDSTSFKIFQPQTTDIPQTDGTVYSETFKIRFRPKTVGTHSAIVKIFSNDDTWAFKVQGTAVRTPNAVIKDNGGTVRDTASAVSFGSLDIAAAPVSITFDLTNSGSGVLRVTSIQFSPASGSWSATLPPGNPLDKYVSDTIQVIFDPDSVGAHPVNVIVNYDDGVGTNVKDYQFAVTGEGIAIRTAKASGLNDEVITSNSPATATKGTHFGEVDILGDTSVTRSFKFTNLGSASVVVNSVSLQTGNRGFSIVNVQPPTTVHLCSGAPPCVADMTVTVTFNPSTDGEKIDAITFTGDIFDNAADFLINLKGTAVLIPQIHVSGRGNSLTSGSVANQANPEDGTDFGTVDWRDTTSVNTYTISNTGTDGLTVASITSSSTAFVVINPITTVVPGGTQDFSVSFDPVEAGQQYTATITIANNAASDFTFVVKGSGIGIPKLEVQSTLGANAEIVSTAVNPATSTSLGTDFGGLDFGVNQVKDNTFRLKNVGSGWLAINNVQITGTNADQFTLDLDPLPGNFPAQSFDLNYEPTGQEATFSIRFHPTSSGVKSANVEVYSNHVGNTPFTFAISGTGVGVPKLSVGYAGGTLTNGAAASIGAGTDFSFVDKASSLSRDFVISNVGSRVMTISVLTLACGGGCKFSTNPPSGTTGTTVPIAGSLTVTVTFTPDNAEGTFTASLSINSDADVPTFTVLFSGVGLQRPNEPVVTQTVATATTNTFSITPGGVTLAVSHYCYNKGDATVQPPTECAILPKDPGDSNLDCSTMNDCSGACPSSTFHPGTPGDITAFAPPTLDVTSSYVVQAIACSVGATSEASFPTRQEYSQNRIAGITPTVGTAAVGTYPDIRGFDGGHLNLKVAFTAQSIGNEIWITFPAGFDFNYGGTTTVTKLQNIHAPTSIQTEGLTLKLQWKHSLGDSAPAVLDVTGLLPAAPPNLVELTVTNLVFPMACTETFYTLQTKTCSQLPLFGKNITTSWCESTVNDVTMQIDLPEGAASACSACTACKQEGTGQHFQCENFGRRIYRTLSGDVKVPCQQLFDKSGASIQ